MLKLESHMMNNENMNKCLDLLYRQTNPIINKKRNVVNNKYFVPYQKDSLFWIYYYMKYGYLEYNLVGSNSYSIETEYKFNLINVIKNNKNVFKDYKLQKINDCIANLSCEGETNFKTFIVLCIVNNISFIYSVKKIYYSLIFDDTEDIFLIHYNNGIYGCEKINNKNIEEYKKNKFEIKYFERPIYSINNYTIDQLKEISNTLDIDIESNNKKIKKNELYNLIQCSIAKFYDSIIV